MKGIPLIPIGEAFQRLPRRSAIDLTLNIWINSVPDPSDIIASILIQDSKINPTAYEASRTHRLVTMQGMMKLNQSLHDVLVKALEKVRVIEHQMNTPTI